MTRLWGCLVVGGVAPFLALGAQPASALGQPLHHQTVRVTVPGVVTGLSVRGEVGNITVVPGSVTRVVATEQWNLAAPTLVHSVHDGLLSVAAPCPKPTGIVDLGFNDCSVDLAITVPSAVTVRAVDSVGDIRVRDLRGAESLHSDVGDIVADNLVAPTLSADSDSGTVRLSAVRSRSLSLRSDSGGIHADLAAMPRTLVARSSDGDVDLTLPAGTYAVDTHTDVGTTHVRGITTNADAPRKVTAHTDDGDIRIVGR
ncbi:MAG TPA: DUF4097 family beta strand repeat-containing protein [Mycobacteriales bacterium]|nr:DUF4097 family beta strand repeat-containing protein [Mycobacteriales bacterium]